jgi:tellurite resistance protein
MKRRNALSPEYNKDNKFMTNQNKTSWIQIRCTQQEKSAIVRQLKDSEKLSEFMLNAASEKIETRKTGKTTI